VGDASREDSELNYGDQVVQLREYVDSLRSWAGEQMDSLRGEVSVAREASRAREAEAAELREQVGVLQGQVKQLIEGHESHSQRHLKLSDSLDALSRTVEEQEKMDGAITARVGGLEGKVEDAVATAEGAQSAAEHTQA